MYLREYMINKNCPRGIYFYPIQWFNNEMLANVKENIIIC